eukprot:6179199-Pleurochrysis_carterae.AAC.3
MTWTACLRCCRARKLAYARARARRRECGWGNVGGEGRRESHGLNWGGRRTPRRYLLNRGVCFMRAGRGSGSGEAGLNEPATSVQMCVG